MSGEINNREYRQKVIRELIKDLHSGKSVDEVKGRFEAAFDGVSAEEIAQAEQALISGGLPVSEVQRLCDVHAAVFKGSIDEIHASGPADIPGHPANTLKLENRAIEVLAGEIRQQLIFPAPGKLLEKLRKLGQIERHYLKKENLLFPYMEQYGITAPPKVMWGVDDEIRDKLRLIVKEAEAGDAPGLKEKVEALLGSIQEMVFKEENIMLPMLLENLTQDEWKRVADDAQEFGFCLIDLPPIWEPAHGAIPPIKAAAASGMVSLPTGILSIQELESVMNALPFDVTFVGKDDSVRYFSENAERIFPRTRTVIGRKVSNCHPPASVHIVEQLGEDLRAGRKDHEDFWIKMGGKYVMIRYFAVRNSSGEYLGVLEVTQDIGPIQAITGEKRLVSD